MKERAAEVLDLLRPRYSMKLPSAVVILARLGSLYSSHDSNYLSTDCSTCKPSDSIFGSTVYSVVDAKPFFISQSHLNLQ